MLIMVHNSKKHGPLCNVWSHKACIHPRVVITVFTVVVEILRVRFGYLSLPILNVKFG